MNAPLRFTFNETKCIEALTFLASQWEGVTKFYAAKVLFYAEKLHLNRYGRPIVADTFVKLGCHHGSTISSRAIIGVPKTLTRLKLLYLSAVIRTTCRCMPSVNPSWIFYPRRT